MRDISQVLENIVYFELLKRGYAVNVGVINKKEINFIATKNKEIIYFQVTYFLSSQDVVKREFGNLVKIPDYPKYIISTDEIDRSCDGIKHLISIDFLLN